MVSKRTQEIIARDDKYRLQMFGFIGTPIELVWEKGKGCILTDTEGKEYIDICTHHQCVNLGYGRKDIHDAMLEQMQKLEYAGVCAPCTHDILGRCAEKLVNILPAGLGHIFFTTGGTESVESAIRIAKFYWNVQGKSSKYKIVSLTNAYHGSAAMTGSLMGIPAGRTCLGPDMPGVIRIPSYYCYRCQFGLEYPKCNMLCARYLESAITGEGDDSVAAFIVEPEQGVGGAVSPPPEYFPIVEKICKEHNVLLIADEVMSGFTRTGKMFAIEHWNTKPDIMAMAKGINSAYFPFGAVAITDKIYEAMKGQLFPVGFTYVGHPVGCASTIASIDAYVKEKVADNAAKVGAHVKERFEKEFLPLPHVAEVSGLGLLLSFEVVKDKATKSRFDPGFMHGTLKPAMLKLGIFPRLADSIYGERVYFTPPCVMTMAEADKAVDILYSVIKDIDKL